MASNKAKEEYINNLDKIRKNLGKTQEDMAEILNVSLKMYRNYERGIEPLPLKRAILIARKYNCSIDFIYKMANRENRTDQFMTDIRDIISYENDKISVKINNSYWQYLYEKNLIEKSNNTTQDKKNRIAELDSQFITENNSIVWQTKFQISKEIFQSYFECDNDKIPCYFEDSKRVSLEIPDERLKEAQNFFTELLNNNEENE